MIRFLRLWFVCTTTLMLIAGVFAVGLYCGLRSPYIGMVVSVVPFISINLLLHVTRKVL